MLLEHLGLIGNCQFSALVERSGAIVWCCLPRFDSEPVFSTLLDEEDGGHFVIAPAGGEPGVQRYIENTNILETRFDTASGSFRLLDFAPRFILHDRIFRPTQLHRIVEPLEGMPRIRVKCEPRLGWSKQAPVRVAGSNHVRYEGFASQLRLTSDVPVSYLEGQPFTLTERKHLVLTWGSPLEEPLRPLSEKLLNETEQYWRRWVKHCSIPSMYQRVVIRSALTLKLHCFEDTGAIIAAMTTSIPESPGSGRTWDYRYCWLRDAYYSLNALQLLGQFEERENFIHYLLNIAGGSADLDLSPLYRVDGSVCPDERILEGWRGFNGHGPVREGNGAVTHRQNDLFGEMVLALAPIFADDRFSAERSPAALQLVERLARKAISVVGLPDAGIWEYRSEWKQQTFSALMCWAAADRMARIAGRHAPRLEAEFRSAAETIRQDIVARAWSADAGSFTAFYGGRDLDASLLQMARLRFLPLDDQRIIRTIDSIRDGLSRDGWLYRYRFDDGFGTPTSAFVICVFWLIEALGDIGRKQEAKEFMDRAHAAISSLGLLSEDLELPGLTMWGNFPQAYSHAGVIHAAYAASPDWADVV